MFLIARLWVLSIVGVLLTVGVANAQSETTKLAVVSELAGPAELVHVQRERVYVAGGHSFTVFDVSDPSNPKELSSYTFPEEIWGFRLTDDRAYIGANFFGLGILAYHHLYEKNIKYKNSYKYCFVGLALIILVHSQFRTPNIVELINLFLIIFVFFTSFNNIFVSRQTKCIREAFKIVENSYCNRNIKRILNKVNN